MITRPLRRESTTRERLRWWVRGAAERAVGGVEAGDEMRGVRSERDGGRGTMEWRAGEGREDVGRERVESQLVEEGS
jgi:hypothetical protein